MYIIDNSPLFIQRFYNLLKKIYFKVWKLLFKLPEIDLDYFVINPEGTYTSDIILDDICLPPYLGTIELDDLNPLLNILRKYNPKLVLEFGTAYGNTTANICNILKDATIYTVNALPEQISGKSITYSILKEDIGRVYKKYNFDDRVIQLYENTVEIELSDYFKKESIDLAIIDACHDTKYVINDFLKIHPYVEDNGIILLHDTHPSMQGHLAGGYYAAMILRSKGYDIKHLCNTWWGIYIK